MVDADADALLRATKEKKAAHRTALKHASAAEQEAQAAAKEWKATASREHAALDRTATKRTAAGEPDADDLPPSEDAFLSDADSEVFDHRDLQQALLFHEAVAIANLHAQAIAV